MQETVKIFNDKELELMISGLPEIDIEDMRNNCDQNGFEPGHRVLHWFWEVVNEINKQDLALLVQFITGTSKVPLDGFKALQVIFQYHLLIYISREYLSTYNGFLHH